MAKKGGKSLDEAIEQYIKNQKLVIENDERIKAGLQGLAETWQKIGENVKQVNFLNKQNKAAKERTKELNKQIKSLEAKEKSASGLNTKEKETLSNYRKEVSLLDEVTKRNNKQIKQLNEQNSLLKQSITSRNVIIGLTKSAFALGGKVTKQLISQKDYLMQQSKAMKDSQLSMGILSSQSNAFTKNLVAASYRTNVLGANVDKLAQMQSDYSEQIGRSARLTQDSLEAMTLLANGTTLGIEGATQMAAEMESFNISVETSKDFMQDTLNLSRKTGVNASLVTKNLLNNIKLANRYRFRGGMDGLKQMAIQAAKLKIDMGSISAMAEKLFNIEGAVEMSSKLQVLGGAWSNLADPFKLMNMARNDIKGLAEEVSKAAAQSANFNRVTGQISFSTLEMHRMREIANATGMEYEKLAEMAKRAKQAMEIKNRITGVVDPELREFIENTAQFDKEKGEFFITLNDNSKAYIDELTGTMQNDIRAVKERKDLLKENARNSKSFDETWNNLKNTFKNMLLPAFMALEQGLTDGVGSFVKWMEDKQFIDKMVGIGESLGDFISGLADFVNENPITSAIGALLGMGLWEFGKWYASGKFLGMGFNSVASTTPGAPISPGGTTTGGPWTKGGTFYKKSGYYDSAGNRWTGKGKIPKGSKFMKGGMTGMGKMGAGIGLGLAGTGLGALRGNMDDPESGLGKGIGIGSAALQGAGLGMMFGPLGALIGGVLGAGYGVYDEYFNDGYAPGRGTYIPAGGKPIAINDKDHALFYKDGGPVSQAAQAMSGGVGANKVEHSHGDVNIKGTIRLEGSGSATNLDIGEEFRRNPALRREVASMLAHSIADSRGTKGPNSVQG